MRVESQLDQPQLWTGPSGKRYEFKARIEAAVDANDLTALLAIEKDGVKAFKVM